MSKDKIQWLQRFLHRVGLQHFIHEFAEDIETSDEELRQIRDLIRSVKQSREKE